MPEATGPLPAPPSDALPDPLPAPLLVALDVDGTLVDHEMVLSDRVRDAVRAVAAAGHHVVVATGRPLEATTPVLAELGLTTGYLVVSNGAVVLRLDPALPGGSEVVEVVTFDPGPAMAILREELPGAAMAVEVPGRGVLLTGAFPDGELEGEQVEVAALDGLAATRVVVRSPAHTPQDFLELTHRVGLKGVNYAVGWTAWLDLAPEGVSKASALELVRTRLGVDRAATLAAGDGRNDLEMLVWAGRSIAMGQAPDEVRAAASEVCRPVAEDGLADVLEGLPGVAAGAAGGRR